MGARCCESQLNLTSNPNPLRSSISRFPQPSLTSAMLRRAPSSLLRPCYHQNVIPSVEHLLTPRFMSSVEPPAPKDRPFFHHGERLRHRTNPKFKSPRKRANILLHELTQESIQKSIEAKPAVFETNFRVGDAIEIEHVEEGGMHATKTERIRGVVIGIFRKGIDHTVLIRDVVFGEEIETGVPLHSPMVRSVKVLEHNFVKKGKKKIKRAKLYYLRDRNPSGKWSNCLCHALRILIVCFLTGCRKPCH